MLKVKTPALYREQNHDAGEPTYLHSEALLLTMDGSGV